MFVPIIGIYKLEDKSDEYWQEKYKGFCVSPY